MVRDAATLSCLCVGRGCVVGCCSVVVGSDVINRRSAAVVVPASDFHHWPCDNGRHWCTAIIVGCGLYPSGVLRRRRFLLHCSGQDKQVCVCRAVTAHTNSNSTHRPHLQMQFNFLFCGLAVLLTVHPRLSVKSGVSRFCRGISISGSSNSSNALRSRRCWRYRTVVKKRKRSCPDHSLTAAAGAIVRQPCPHRRGCPR